MASYTPLYDPERDATVYVLPVPDAIEAARATLDEKAEANIHDHNEMIRAAVGLEMRLRGLLNALDREEGGR